MYSIYSRLRAGVNGTTLVQITETTFFISVTKHLFLLMKAFVCGFGVLVSDKPKNLNWYDG